MDRRSATGPAAALAAIGAAFDSAEGMEYLGESVTMIEHQLQAAARAAAVGSPTSVIVAALLHDIGHIAEMDDGGPDAAAAMAADTDAHHDTRGARWLAQWFGPEVTEPVRLHVAAKRFLVATEPGYAAMLSDASVHTLRLQGGPMTAAEVDEFRASPYAADAISLRRFDEAAKVAGLPVPGLAAYAAVVGSLVRT
jgi:gamma-butyrobetaine dioxygenase